jgi:hypothetical protein
MRRQNYNKYLNVTNHCMKNHKLGMNQKSATKTDISNYQYSFYFYGEASPSHRSISQKSVSNSGICITWFCHANIGNKSNQPV